MLPVEVKNNNLKAKSLKHFIDKYQIKAAVKLSNHPYFHQGVVANFPLYQVGLVREIGDEQGDPSASSSQRNKKS